MNNEIKILIAFPDTTYYIWQVLVQINNFEKMNYLKNAVYVVGVKDMDKINPALLKLKNDNIVDIHFYLDERVMKKNSYVSTLRPHILKKYFIDYPNNAKAYFYVDPDLIFTKKIKFDDLIKNNIWYVSDTKSYLDTKYIKGKSEELFYRMCDIIGIDPELVENNDKNAGGAQYLLKNVDSFFWRQVEYNSTYLYDLMITTSNEYSPQHPIQSWTADMWAILWTAWKRGENTKIIKRFDFSWATDNIDKWKKCGMHHNAGVSNQEYLFNKGRYSSVLPFNADLSHVNSKYCSFNYIKEIKETNKKYNEIIKLIK